MINIFPFIIGSKFRSCGFSLCCLGHFSFAYGAALWHRQVSKTPPVPGKATRDPGLAWSWARASCSRAMSCPRNLRLMTEDALQLEMNLQVSMKVNVCYDQYVCYAAMCSLFCNRQTLKRWLWAGWPLKGASKRLSVDGLQRDHNPRCLNFRNSTYSSLRQTLANARKENKSVQFGKLWASWQAIYIYIHMFFLYIIYVWCMYVCNVM